MQTSNVGCLFEVGLLRSRQGLADRHRTGAVTELLGETAVDALAVFEEVGVAVLVAGAGDEGRLLPGKGLRPVQGNGHSRDRFSVDDVVPGMATCTEDDGVLEVSGRRSEKLRAEDARLEVGSQRAVGAEVASEEGDVMAAPEKLGAQLGGRPGLWVVR